ncbi:ScbA/BarX family gamma-butyrolactone biosynthesis protein [Streptomyces sp. NPDC053367]|uniref:ScbA/BarX family gamma-butyrolactone biosynthesis protein n=1 Tax=Streptomyces sp. NPDC053367 TaxID=3365700 RepID=UPI0037D1909C
MTASTFRAEHTTAGLVPAQGAYGAPATPSGFRYPSLTTTVPKELVHRAAVAEVMLTDWWREGETRFAMQGQWPRGHSFFTPVAGHHDPLIAAETIRQAGILLAHAEFGVPLGHQFLVSDLDVTVDPRHMIVGDTPASLDITVDCPDVRMRGTSLAGLRIAVEIRRDGEIAARGGGALASIAPPVYRRLRGARADAMQRVLPLTAPAAPQLVGRMSPTDVTLTPVGEADRWQLRVDTRHPVLFDHPLDHVPGMLLMEAARQAAAAALRRPVMLPLSITNEFLHYVELDAPCMIEARRDPSRDDRVTVSAYQDDAVVFRSTVVAARIDG